ncbi:MAG: PEP-CTERM sorting domain-containing protein [Phycisphaerae bacterium]
MRNTVIALTVLFLLAGAAQADWYSVDFTTLNNSGVTGTALLNLTGNQLDVEILAIGVEPDQLHAQHIHGLSDPGGTALNSTVPNLAEDDDGDGYIEVAEGAETYGPVLLPLTSPQGDANAFPTPAIEAISFEETYLLSDDELADLLPLDKRIIVLHGLSICCDGVGEGTPGEVDGTPGYKVPLPVAAGEIVPVVPEPVSLVLLVSGGALLLKRRRR